MAKPSTSRSGRRRIAGERTANRPVARRPGPLEGAVAEPTAPATVPAPAPPARPKLSLVSPAVEQPEAAAVPDDARPARRGPSNLLLAVLAVLAAAVVAAAAYFAVPAWRARGVEQAQSTAPSVAERAATAILSYDYRSLGHDEKAAAAYLTPSYRKKYENTFSLVKRHAPDLKAKVTARVLGSGVAQADPDHAHVLLFVNQTTNSAANPGRPQIALNRVMLDMVRRDGRWLVNGITSY